MVHLKIRYLREQRHLRDEDMAVRLCMSQSAYSRLEKGETKLDVERLLKIAELLEVPVAELFMPIPGDSALVAGAQTVGQEPTDVLLQRLVDLYTAQQQEVQEVNARYARLTARILVLLGTNEG